mmetsp:Transcript_82339/g.156562  ORF Transcript_82339/g.156562 Transcript_82339/m.156562 type:complete len:765 (-) Transcript_82339:79-2373(-)
MQPFAELVFASDNYAKQAYQFLRPNFKIDDTMWLRPKAIGHMMADIADRLSVEGNFPGRHYVPEVSLEFADSVKLWRESLSEVTSSAFTAKVTRAAMQAEAAYGYLGTWGPRFAALRWCLCITWIAARATLANLTSAGGSYGTVDPKKSADSLRQTKLKIFKILQGLLEEAPLLKVFDFDLIGYGVYINGGAEPLPRGGTDEWFRRQMEYDVASMCRQARDLPPPEVNDREPTLPILRPYGEPTWHLPPPKALRFILERHKWYCHVQSTVKEGVKKEMAKNEEDPVEALKRRALARMQLERSGTAAMDLKAALAEPAPPKSELKKSLQSHYDNLFNEEMDTEALIASATEALEEVKPPVAQSLPAKAYIQGALLIMDIAPPDEIDLSDADVISKIQRGEDLGKGSQEDGLPGAIHGSIGLLFAGMCAVERLDNIRVGQGLLEIDSFLEVFLQYSTSIKLLDMSHTKGALTEEHLRVLPQARGTLQTLDLSSSGLEEQHVNALADAFEALPGLKHVDLSDNTLERPAALRFIGMLTERRVDLSSLRLDRNPLGDGELFGQDLAAIMATRGDTVVAGGELVLHQTNDAVLWYAKPRSGTLADRRRDDTMMLGATSVEELELGALARNEQLDLIDEQGMDPRTTNDVGRELLRQERQVNDDVLEHPMMQMWHESVYGGLPGSLQPPDRTLPTLPGGDAEMSPRSPTSPGGRGLREPLSPTSPTSPGGRSKGAMSPTSPTSPLSPKSPWGPASPGRSPSNARSARGVG